MPMPQSNPSFSKSTRFGGSVAKFASPGPGTYETRGAIGGKSYSMRAKTNNYGKEAQTPGPGAYAIGTYIGKGLSKSMSVGNIRGNLRTATEVPGPGTYSQVRLEDNTVHKAPAYSMRPRTTYMNKSGGNPGPGTYVIATNIGKGLKKSMSQRTLTSNHKNNLVPGPGTYAPISAGHRAAPSYTLRPKTSFMSDNDQSPGPGTYNLSTSIGRGPSKTMSYKTNLKSKLGSKTPGPGTYKANETWFGGSKGLSASMKGSRVAGRDEATPGPAAYRPSDPTSVKNKAPSYTMRARTAMSNGSRATPGPVYDIKGSLGNVGSPSYTMRPRTKMETSSRTTPGPDVYSPGITKGVKSPSYSMRARTKSNRHANTPGPKYDPRRLHHAPSYTMRGRNY